MDCLTVARAIGKRYQAFCSCALFSDILLLYLSCWLFVQQVWVVLKPGFLALLEDPFDPKLLDVIIFDALPHMDINGEGQISLAKEIKERNPLHFGFQVPIPYRKFCVQIGTCSDL